MTHRDEVLRTDNDILVGSLEPGKAADFTAVSLDRIEYAGALHDPVAALLFFAPVTVDHTYVHGRAVVSEGAPVRIGVSAPVVTHLGFEMLYLGRSDWMGVVPPDDEDFTAFVKEVEPRLSMAMAAAYGVEVGAEATADALAYAWEHWAEVGAMVNPAGYLYRVGQTAARRYRRTGPLFPAVNTGDQPDVEPGLPDALGRLSEAQRVAVVLVHVLEWTEREAAAFLGVNRSTVRRHRDRGLAKLRAALEVTTDA